MDALAYARAAALHLRARLGLSQGDLVPASSVIRDAAASLSLPVAPLPSGDPLLAGARALLDRALGLIAVDRTLPPQAQAFSVAHELGHAVLHAADAHCAPAEGPQDESLPPALLETYSPLQRREAEASVFAAELLAPVPVVWDAYGRGMTPRQIAATCRLSEALVLSQLMAACFAEWQLHEPDVAADDAQILLLAGLDPGQHAAATAASGPVVLDAGPGAGKTRALLGRIAFLLEQGETPDGILVLTFSVAAASELRERLRALLPDAGGVTVSTIHAFALDLLRRYSEAAGLPFDLRVLDGFATRRVLEGLLPSLTLQEHRNLHDPAEPLGALLQAIARAQDEAWSAAEFEEQAAAVIGRGGTAQWARRAQEAAAVYRAYIAALDGRGAVDFGEMVRRALTLLRTRSDVTAALRAQYRAVLVDEYQDTNRATALLLRELAGDGRGLWVVGDVRQAIYRFRGAAPSNFRAFAADFPGARRLPLARVYRSRPQIVATLQAASPALLPDEPEPLWESVRGVGAGPAVALAVAPDGAAELRGLADAIAARRDAGTPLRDQAVLCRTHAQAEEVTAALHTRGLPALAALPFMAAAGVRAVLGALAVLAGDDAGRLPLAEWHGAAYDGPELDAVITRLRAEHGAEPDAYRTLLRLVFAEDGPVRWLASSSAADATRETAALRHLVVLAAAARHDPFAKAEGVMPPAGLLAWLRARIAAGDERAATPERAAVDAAPVLTVHAAKGREFPVVYVPNLAEGRFPSRGRRPATPLPPDLTNRGEATDLDEEAALLFVAMSRARDYLVLSHAQTYGGAAVRPSPLLRRLQGVFTALPPVRLRWDATAPRSPAANDPLLDGGGEDANTTSSPTAESGAGRQSDNGNPVHPTPSVEEGEMLSLRSARGRSVPFDDLLWYRRCPRQFFYGSVIGLAAPDARVRTDASLLGQGMAAVLAWLRSQGEGVATPDAAAEFFAAWWERHGAGHPFAADVLEAGEQAARRAVRMPRTAGAPTTFAVEVEGGTISAEADAAVVSGDGGLVLTLALTGAGGEGERMAGRAAALRTGARQAGWTAEVETVALLTGDRRPLAAGPAEDAERLAGLARMAGEIAAQRYPARPDRRERCATCPWVLVCPA